jgi:hypothetical protein
MKPPKPSEPPTAEPHVAPEAPEQSPAAPTHAEIAKAIQTLAAFGLSQEQTTSDPLAGRVGEVLIEYDVRISTPGRKTYQIKGRRVAHQILVEMGIPDAPQVLDEVINEITRPLRTHAMAWIAAFTKETNALKTGASATGQPTTKRQKPWKPDFM